MAKRKVPTQYHPPQDVDGNALKELDGEKESRWWLAPADRIHALVMSRVRFLRGRQRARREMYRFYAEIYGTHELFGLGLTNYDPANVAFVAPSLPYNVVRRGVNTLLAKITQHKPLPMVMTERGDYKKTKRALAMTDFLAGAFYALKVFNEMRGMARDALVFGTGILRIHHNAGDEMPRLDRILPWEVVCDIADARYGKPKQLFFVRWMDKTVLKERYPTQANVIERSTSSSGLIDDMPDYAQQGDMVLVTEAYRLPVKDGKRSAPGRYALCIDNVTLEEAPYDKPYFPVVMLKYAEPVIGMWGDGLAAEMAGFQYDINYTVETVRMGTRSAGTGIWMVPDNADIPDAHFENGVGLIMRHRPGAVPTYENPAPLHPQTMQYLATTTEDAMKWSGISTMSANAEKPKGVTAAVAMDAIQDVESTGLAVFEDAYEDAAVEIADHLIDEFKDLYEENPGLQVFAAQKRSLLAIKWGDVDMPRDAIQMQVWPTSLLGRTPAARLQMVNDLYSGGIIDRGKYLKLLDAPDIDAENDLATAMQEVADEQIANLLDLEPGNDNAAAVRKSRPSMYQDLVYAMHRAQQHICFGQLRGVPDEILEYLRTYIEDCKTEMDKPAQEAAKKAAEAQAQATAQMQGQSQGLGLAPMGPPGAPPPGPAPMAPPPGAAPPPGPGPGAPMNGAPPMGAAA